MIAVALITHTDAPYPFASVTGLIASGFTQDQAEAILVITRETTVAAITRLEEKLARWHVLLALYTLIQFGVVLLVVLISQTRQQPLPRSAAIVGGDPPRFSLPSAASASDVCSAPARFAMSIAEAGAGASHVRSGTHPELTCSREASVVSLRSQRALIN